MMATWTLREGARLYARVPWLCSSLRTANEPMAMNVATALVLDTKHNQGTRPYSLIKEMKDG